MGRSSGPLPKSKPEHRASEVTLMAIYITQGGVLTIGADHTAALGPGSLLLLLLPFPMPKSSMVTFRLLAATTRGSSLYADLYLHAVLSCINTYAIISP